MVVLQISDYQIEVDGDSPNPSFGGGWLHSAEVVNIATGLGSWVVLKTETEDRPTDQAFFEAYKKRSPGEWRHDEFGSLVWYDAINE